MERRGRDEVDVIARETSNETGKTEEEVRRYHKVFWERHKELADWERVIDKIEKGEKRLQRSKEIREALAEKIARFATVWNHRVACHAIDATSRDFDGSRRAALSTQSLINLHTGLPSPMSVSR